ncbi:hypothetical protein GCM10020367_65960 [Streptomyces sannanensis]|uniref:Uncharacterized protein n=1 Tax=Streptomyces sannanensis TaxID=285536 RepID=A0ABP6S414_9ACTN
MVHRAETARRAGQSVAALQRCYAKVLDGEEAKTSALMASHGHALRVGSHLAFHAAALCPAVREGCLTMADDLCLTRAPGSSEGASSPVA